MSTEREIEVYLAEAASWDADRARQARRSARVAWSVAATGWFAAVAAIAAVMLLMPLKRVEPFVIRVDNSTGIVDVVPVYTGAAGFDETLTRALLTHYVTVCQRFNFPTSEMDYNECGSFHTAPLNQAWYAAWDQSNPASPLNVNKDGTTVRAHVKSVSFFNRANGIKDLAQVRYIKAVRPGGSGPEKITHWIASVQYAFGPPSKKDEIRARNPYGFKIIDFKPEAEILPDSTPLVDSSAGKSP